MPASMDSLLTPFTRPRGVLVIGASTSPEKLGYGIARNLVNSGYSGAIHFLGQRAGELFGRPVHTQLHQVPDPVDLAVLALPSSATPEVLAQCGQRGIRAAIIVSAGFREAGPAGEALERECVRVAREHGMRLLGPNCIGIIDTALPLDTSFLQPPMPGRGGISFLSHSGAFCAAVIDWARGEGFGFSRVVSLGNQADLTETDWLEATADDPAARVIALYLEGVSDGRRFISAGRAAAQQKPVVALKVGRSEEAQKAAASHTGAMAASDRAFDAAFASAGIFRASTATEMFDWARALEGSPLPGGKSVAILTDAGGPGVIAADALHASGLTLAALSSTTQASLAAGLPPAASVQNPVDMLASASPEDYARSLKLLLEDAGVDAGIVILPPPPMFTAEAVAQAVIPVVRASSKPVMIALMGSTLVREAQLLLDRAGIPAYPFPERAASALAILVRRTELMQRRREQPIRPVDITGFHVLPEAPGWNAESLVAAYGIATLPTRLATSADQAAAIAVELGLPVVLKIASSDILHKSDVAGVLPGVSSAADTISGYAQVLRQARTRRPDAILDGVRVQKQAPPGVDLILGAVQDPTFGPLVMFGAGGVQAEAVSDVAFAIPPLSDQAAARMMESTLAGQQLRGWRGNLPADWEAVQAAVVRFSWLACEHSEIREIEINPLRALEKGAVALDVRAIL